MPPKPAARRAVTTTLLVSLSLAALAVPHPASAATDPWVRTWGTNGYGQLGNATSATQPTPADVVGVARTDVRTLSGGGGDENGFAVALLTDGTLRSWGANAQGQLGNGTTTSQAVPTAVAGLSGVSAVDAGSNHVLAVRKGRVYAWGSNAYGQLGIGSFDADGKTGPKKTPLPVGLYDVKDVGAGCNFSVALRNDNTVWTWGDGSGGRLGIGSTVSRETPQQIEGLTDIAAISVGCSHVLALTLDNKVKSWGEGFYGQLGNDTKSNSPTPTDVKRLSDVATIHAGYGHDFAILEDGTVKGWGWNKYGQLGDGDVAEHVTPVIIDKLKGTKRIAAGWDFTLAAQPDGSVLTLGNNDYFQLGDGTSIPTAARDHTPVRALPNGSGITRVSTTTTGRSAYAY
ncbi:chromosome condensation regulator RCC1 [Streptomyces sp. SJL17-4]|uniref:RCC1 domain-containing protein n=1 Tax=Streptomyces sp. SJL17-4 TaxID=2967224 RepID=UPI0030D338AB